MVMAEGILSCLYYGAWRCCNSWLVCFKILDDFSLDFARYWKHNWTHYFSLLPADWNIIQIAIGHEDTLKQVEIKAMELYVLFVTSILQSMLWSLINQIYVW